MYGDDMKVIIEFDEKHVTSSEAMASVAAVISAGRISCDGEAFCYLTRFADGLRVSARKNAKSDKFTVWRMPTVGG